MNIKWTHELVKVLFESKGYILVSENYSNNHKKLIFKDLDGYYYYKSLSTFINSGQNKFDKSNPYTIQNIKLWCKLNSKPFKLANGQKYNGATKKLKWNCFICSEIFEMSWNNIHTGQGCPFCASQQVGLSNCLATKNPKLASQWNILKNNNLTTFDVLPNSNKKVWWICDNGHEWKALISSRNSGCGCPQCSESNGEKRVKKVLNCLLVDYIWQQKFDGLIGLGSGNLSYDFYLPDYNLLIEYQGEQHERPVDFKGLGKKYAKEQFKIQQEHDKRKREYAQKHNINLLEIWYYDFDNIEKILDKYLLDLKEAL